jgi:hypothetical protein
MLKAKRRLCQLQLASTMRCPSAPPRRYHLSLIGRKVYHGCCLRTGSQMVCAHSLDCPDCTSLCSPPGFHPSFPLDSPASSWIPTSSDFGSPSQEVVKAIVRDQFCLSDRQPGDISIVQLASILGRHMPESYGEEHLNWAETIRDGNIQGVYEVCAKRLIFSMANSLHQHLSVDEWQFVTALL